MSETTQDKIIQVRKYKVYLYKADDCKRGWLSYLKPDREHTMTVIVESEDGQRAKNKAITIANRNLAELDIHFVNFTDSLWGVNNFPELKKELESLGITHHEGSEWVKL